MPTTPYYHLAQINIARMRAPLDDPLMRDFVALLAPVNAIADGSPGFVWRRQSDEGDATAFRIYDDARLLVNITVWETPDHLKEYTYKSGHVGVMRRRQDWFEPMQTPAFAMWWIPAGHLPSQAEAQQRLELIGRRGDGPGAFTFRNLQPLPDQPAASAPDPPGLDRGEIDYRDRTFIAAGQAGTGDVTPATVFRYHQRGSRVWATYEGGHVRFGSLVASAAPNGALDMRYQHLNDRDEWRTGRCSSVPERLADGRLRLTESWQWTNGDLAAGRSVLEEVRAV